MEEMVCCKDISVTLSVVIFFTWMKCVSSMSTSIPTFSKFFVSHNMHLWHFFLLWFTNVFSFYPSHIRMLELKGKLKSSPCRVHLSFITSVQDGVSGQLHIHNCFYFQGKRPLIWKGGCMTQRLLGVVVKRNI
jgi:hypothetical protein